jgi:hypothetical protein
MQMDAAYWSGFSLELDQALDAELLTEAKDLAPGNFEPTASRQSKPFAGASTVRRRPASSEWISSIAYSVVDLCGQGDKLLGAGDPTR